MFICQEDFNELHDVWMVEAPQQQHLALDVFCDFGGATPAVVGILVSILLRHSMCSTHGMNLMATCRCVCFSSASTTLPNAPALRSQTCSVCCDATETRLQRAP